ncbi:MAG: type II toxin-antitoxin system mRNA interferase toxin, RelE/StbE family [Patescibacteria group bacterium]
MQYFLSKNFEKQFRKLSKKIKDRALEKLRLFTTNPRDRHLNNHHLAGEWTGYRSIDITADIRAVYKEMNKDKDGTNIVRFDSIGSHSELYE